MPVEQVVIIGAGPAGMAAALQLRRSGMQPVILERDTIGGLLNNAYLVENYPGWPHGIPGPKLVELMHTQLSCRGVAIRRDLVERLDRHDGLFCVKTSGNRYLARSVIVASGTKPLKPTGLNIPPEVAAKVFYDVFALREVMGKTIAVVGAGDAAFDYALNLSAKNEVILLNRQRGTKALPLLVQRVMSHGQITYHRDTALLEVTPSADQVTLHCTDSTGTRGLKKDVTVDLLVFAIGREPQLDFLGPELTGRNLQEQTPNLYFCGDVGNGLFRQSAIAVADGIKAAMTICYNRGS